jgi:hypothetical protein
MSGSITNLNCKNNPSNDIYEDFNKFIFSPDIKLLGKLLHRYKFLNMVADLPGDIVEIGVFKGSGIATFQKIIEIFYPNSMKKVIGFDIFDVEKSGSVLSKDSIIDRSSMKKVYERVDVQDLTILSISKRLDDMKLSNKAILIEGDVADTLPKFVSENPGFRASIIYIDVDLERPTYISLKYLWDRLLPGGIILLDEYEYHVFSESNGVDKFLREMNIPYNVKSTQFMAPSAFIVKSQHT